MGLRRFLAEIERIPPIAKFKLRMKCRIEMGGELSHGASENGWRPMRYWRWFYRGAVRSSNWVYKYLAYLNETPHPAQLTKTTGRNMEFVSDNQESSDSAHSAIIHIPSEINLRR